MILVTGANGHLGNLVIDFLNKNNAQEPIAGLVRSEEKGRDLKEKGVEVRIGDYYDKQSLTRALTGVKTLVLVSSSSLENRDEQHKQVIDAAMETGVTHIFYTSLIMADKLLSALAPDHNETEKYLEASGVNYTIFRNTFYADLFPSFLGNALESGNWVFPSNGKTINLAFRSEMAEALANAVGNADAHKNKVYEITSRSEYTFEQLADIISQKSGKKITYTDLPVEEFMKSLEGLGLDEGTLIMTEVSADTVASGALSYTTDHLQEVLGREPRTVESAIDELI